MSHKRLSDSISAVWMIICLHRALVRESKTWPCEIDYFYYSELIDEGILAVKALPTPRPTCAVQNQKNMETYRQGVACWQEMDSDREAHYSEKQM